MQLNTGTVGELAEDIMRDYKMNYELQISALLLILSVQVLAQQSGTGSLKGAVELDDGSAISGALVSAQLQVSSSAAHGNARTIKDGTYEIDGLVPGTYQVCVQPSKDPYLSTCDWNIAPTTAIVKASSTTTVPIIQLQKGVPIQVQILDAQQLLPTAEGKTPGAGILVGLWLPSGLFLTMPVQTKGASSRTYATPVPVGVQVSVSVLSNAFQMSDGNGKAVDPQKGASTPTQINTGGPSQSFTYSITGKKSTAAPNQ